MARREAVQASRPCSAVVRSALPQHSTAIEIHFSSYSNGRQMHPLVYPVVQQKDACTGIKSECRESLGKHWLGEILMSTSKQI